MVYTQSQWKALLECFEHHPHPDKATRQRLAKEIGVPIPRIRTWFRNRRRKQRKELASSLRRDSIQGHDQSRLQMQGCLTKEATPDQIPLPSTPRGILVQAFERNQVPDAAAREQLAKQMGAQELSVQMCFQNQRSLDPDWSKREPINFLACDINGRPDLPYQLQEAGLFIHSDGSYHLPSASCYDNQTTPPAPLLSSEIRIVQPTQAVRGGETCDLPLTFMNHPPELLTPGEGFSDAQVPFWTQFQEECQNHNEQTGIRVRPLEDHPQPPPENKGPQDLGHIDISYIMWWWDQGRQALMKEWEPLEEMQ